jgi:hypothetical protein
MNLSLNQGSSGGNAGAVELGGSAKAAPVNFQVGAVGFGPNWSAEDSMAASIVRLECEADELRAEVAMLKRGMVMLAQERDNARERVKVLSKCWREAELERDNARDTVLKLRRERAAQDAVIATYRDEACRESCRDKASADGGWANI